MDSEVLINILDNQENGIIILNKHKEVLYINKRTRELLGNDINQLLGDYLNCENTIKEKVSCQNTTRCSSCTVNRAINRVMKTKKVEVLNSVEVKKNDIEINLSMKISLCEDEYILIELFNLYIKKLQTDFLTKLADRSKDIMFFKDEELRYLYVNKTYADFLNKEKDYIIGKTDLDLVSENLLDIKLYEQCLVGDKETLDKGYYHGIEVIGEKSFRVSKENIDGGILGVARDITNEVKAIKRSEVDHLTGLYNRYKLEDTIKEIYLNGDNENYVAIIDLDDLRELNNNHGHIKGDEYLSIIGKIFKEQKDGIFFRVGGDEFIGIINYKKHSIESVFKRIFKEIEQLNLNPKLSISVGVAKFDINRSYIDNYKIADSILYEVKTSGKNKIIIRND